MTNKQYIDTFSEQIVPISENLEMYNGVIKMQNATDDDLIEISKCCQEDIEELRIWSMHKLILRNEKFDYNPCVLELSIKKGAGSSPTALAAEGCYVLKQIFNFYIDFGKNKDDAYRVLDARPFGINGIGDALKSACIMFDYEGAYGDLKHETGEHLTLLRSIGRNNERSKEALSRVIVYPVSSLEYMKRHCFADIQASKEQVQENKRMYNCPAHDTKHNITQTSVVGKNNQDGSEIAKMLVCNAKVKQGLYSQFGDLYSRNLKMNELRRVRQYVFTGKELTCTKQIKDIDCETVIAQPVAWKLQ